MFISIIVTTYNYEKYVREAVNSALDQDFSSAYEVIVVDDCSTDRTLQILDEFDSLIRINNKKNLSIEVSVNKAIRASTGKYIVRLDADDYLDSCFLSEMFKHIESENVFYYGDYTIVSKNSLPLSKVNLPKFEKKEIECRGDFLATGTVYSRAMLLSVGLYDESVRNCGLENYQLVLSLMSKGFTGQHIKRNLFFYRRHGNNLSSERLESIVNYGYKIADRYGLDSYAVNQYHPYLDFENMDTKMLNRIIYTEQ